MLKTRRIILLSATNVVDRGSVNCMGFLYGGLNKISKYKLLLYWWFACY